MVRFLEMVDGFSSFGVPLTRKLDAVDPMELEQWPLVQSFAIQGPKPMLMQTQYCGQQNISKTIKLLFWPPTPPKKAKTICLFFCKATNKLTEQKAISLTVADVSPRTRIRGLLHHGQKNIRRHRQTRGRYQNTSLRPLAPSPPQKKNTNLTSPLPVARTFMLG